METTTEAPPVTRDGLWPMPPGPPHEERHFTQNGIVRDLVSGAADGLTLPFAAAIGLALVAANPLVVAAGLAIVAAGAVARGLGGWLKARSEAAHYALERQREEEETVEYTDRERWEVAAILHRYGVRGDALRLAVDSICADTRRWVDFMMRFELDLQEPEPRRAARTALVAGGAFALAGLIPLLPFMLMASTGAAVALSVVLSAGALGGFGWLKARGAGLPPLPGAMQAMGIGAGAALAAVVVVRAAIG